MANSQIEWTDTTWNPVAGCSMVKSGCLNCYAMEMSRRLEAMGVEKYRGLLKKTNHKMIWNGIIREDKQALSLPYKWKKPRKIFVNSMSDLFHSGVSDNFIHQIWKVMEDTPRHFYQILTKRPQRMADFVTKLNRVLPNVWLGTSVENQEVTDRIEHLRGAPAIVRFISFEPLIGSVGNINLNNIHWAIVGGESGSSARPIKEEWIDDIYDACRIYNTAFFFKQWGRWGKDNKKRSKKANGRKYKGAVWNELPIAYNI